MLPTGNQVKLLQTLKRGTRTKAGRSIFGLCGERRLDFKNLKNKNTRDFRTECQTNSFKALVIICCIQYGNSKWALQRKAKPTIYEMPTVCQLLSCSLFHFNLLIPQWKDHIFPFLKKRKAFTPPYVRCWMCNNKCGVIKIK